MASKEIDVIFHFILAVCKTQLFERPTDRAFLGLRDEQVLSLNPSQKRGQFTSL